ncbi:MAG: hypothetical protein AB9856_00925 [Cellulosilyticaceae bacterium]
MGHNFKEDLKKAEVSEEKFLEWAKRNNCPIRDVRYDKEYQKKDIDFLFKNDDVEKEWMGIEIKSDTGIFQYGNLCIELVSNRYTNSEGWWQHTKNNSKWLMFYMPQIDRYYRIKTKNIKDYIKQHGFDKTRNVFNSYCGFININNFCNWKGVNKDDILFDCDEI